METLSDDMLASIFLQMIEVYDAYIAHVVCILQLKRVCKRWYLIIGTNQYIASRIAKMYHLRIYDTCFTDLFISNRLFCEMDSNVVSHWREYTIEEQESRSVLLDGAETVVLETSGKLRAIDKFLLMFADRRATVYYGDLDNVILSKEYGSFSYFRKISCGALLIAMEGSSQLMVIIWKDGYCEQPYSGNSTLTLFNRFYTESRVSNDFRYLEKYYSVYCGNEIPVGHMACHKSLTHALGVGYGNVFHINNYVDIIAWRLILYNLTGKYLFVALDPYTSAVKWKYKGKRITGVLDRFITIDNAILDIQTGVVLKKYKREIVKLGYSPDFGRFGVCLK